jgi:hypothetical protein
MPTGILASALSRVVVMPALHKISDHYPIYLKISLKHTVLLIQRNIHILNHKSYEFCAQGYS